MASHYDEIRKRLREGAAAARTELHNRASSGNASRSSTSTVSKYDTIRNRTATQPTVAEKQTTNAYTTAQNRNEQRMQGMESAAPTVERKTKVTIPPINQTSPTDIMGAIQNFQATHPVTETKSHNEQLADKLKNVPVIGSAIRGLDWLSAKTEPAANVALDLYTPGAGLGAIASAEQAGANLTSRLLPRAASTAFKASPQAAYAIEKAAPLAGRVATDASIGAYTGAGQSLAAHPEQGLKGAAEGAIGGALGGAAIPVVGAALKGASKYANIRNTRAAVNGAEQTGTNAAQAAAQPAQENYTGNWFTNLFGNQGVGITAGAKKARGVSDTIVNSSIKEAPRNLAQKAVDVARDAHKALVNRFEPLKKGGSNVFEAAEDATRANQIANQIMGKEFVTPEGQVVGEGFENLMKSVPRGEDRTLFDYLIVKDAQARVPRGERVFDEKIKIPDPQNPMNHIELNSEAGLQARRDQLERQYPWLPAMSQRWNAFTKNLRDVYGVKEGLLTDDANTALETARPDYIKMMRQFERREKPMQQRFGGTTEGFSGKKEPIKSVNKKGSARKIVDPRITMAESVGQWVNNAMRNRVAQELITNIKADPDAFKGIAEIIPDTLTNPQTGGTFKNKIINSDNVVKGRVNGEDVNVRIHDPEFAEAMKGLNPTQLGLVLRIAKAGSDFTKRSATGVLAPAFAAKSAIVDLPTALIQAKGNRARFLGDYVHALASGFASKFGNNRLAQLAKDYERAGGGFSAALRGEKALNKAKTRLERNPLLSGRAAWNATKATVSAPFKATESVANVFENAPRIAAAKGELRRLGGQRTPENIRRAMQEGREITVNYSRKGTVSDELEAISPYTNAALQGVSRLARQITKKPVQTIAGITAIVGLPKAYEYTQFHDDPDYQRLPAREKFRNLIISKNADGTFNKIPLEPSYAAFGAAALDFYQYVKDKDPDAFKGMADSLSNAFLPPLASGALQGLTQGAEGTESPIEKSLGGLINATSAAPAASIFANQSFTGAPIDSAAVADRSPQYRYDEKTSSIAKWIGKKLNFSPMKTDYLLKQYGGDLSRIGLPTFSDVGTGTKQQTLLRNFIVDPVFTNNLTNDYYMGKSLISAAEKDSADVGAPLPKWYNQDLAKELSTTKKGSITRQLKELGDQKRMVNGNKALSAADKAQQLRNIQRQMNNLYIEANAKMDAAGIPFPKR